MRDRNVVLALIVTLVVFTAYAEEPRKRALLIGINDYSAARLPALPKGTGPGRYWTNLDGAVNDVGLMRDLLVALYGFDRSGIVSITDEQATRAAILCALDRLAGEAKKGDVLLFYFSGHGSQVLNSKSNEPDGMDESLVPADSRLGVRDIHDKELRTRFNCILSRGARLTVILDACHSGSGARGLAGGMNVRGISADMRDVADRTAGGRPEDGGALVISAARDFDLAFETMNAEGKIYGAFSWALARAMRDAIPGEAAGDTFKRAEARLRVEMPAQNPVAAGGADALLSPFLSTHTDRRAGRPVIAVEKITRDGVYVLQGGWANGVTVGSELRVQGQNDLRLEVTSLLGVTRSEARIVASTAVRGLLHPGMLLEIATWAAPPGRPLRVWIPIAPDELLAAAGELRREAERRSIKWIDDPTATTPTHVLRWRDAQGEIVANGNVLKGGISDVPRGGSVFVQLPAPARLAAAIGSVDGVERTSGPETADYMLVGRIASGIEYAWVRPLVTTSDQPRAVMPMRSAWTPGAANETPLVLRDALLRLSRVLGWHDLPAPLHDSRYRLAVRRLSDGAFVDDGKLVGASRYRLVLRARDGAPAEPVYARYLYAFVIDSYGRSTVLFPPPQIGPIENLLPATSTPGEPVRNPPAELPLCGDCAFRVTEPYGLDTYFLLSTDQPLSTLACLEWDGVRGTRSLPLTPLEKLLSQSAAGTRGGGEQIITSPDWSIERFVFESIPPRKELR